MSRTLLVMAAGSGGHIFGSGPLEDTVLSLDLAARAKSACTENVATHRGGSF
jgi:hypothetical protein